MAAFAAPLSCDAATTVDGPRSNPFEVSWQERAIVLGTVLLSIALCIPLGLMFAPTATRQLLILVPSSFVALGKFLPLAGLRAECALGPYQLGLVIGVMDTITCLLVVYSLQALYRFRSAARLFDRAHDNAALVLEAYPWMRRFAITALTLFVLFPVSGTGAIGGSFVGALLGLHRARVIASISAGGFLGGGLMAFLSMRFGEAVRGLGHNPYLLAALAVFLGGVVFTANRAYRNALSRVRVPIDPTTTGGRSTVATPARGPRSG